MYRQEGIKPYGDNGTKRQQVERMFNNIAHSYDTLNHTLSLGVDRMWRKCAIRYLKRHRERTDTILDVATGTGDLAILACRELHPARVVGCDISEGMMEIARRKVAREGLDDIVTFQNEDCSRLTFADDTFDAVISAFALRNFQNLDQCLAEMRRVLRGDGHLSVIDLCAPVSFPMRQLFAIYKKCVMPLLGRLLSRDRTAYTYLPDTMDAIPQAEQMRAIIQKAGFRDVAFRRLAFGMCILYTAHK